MPAAKRSAVKGVVLTEEERAYWMERVLDQMAEGKTVADTVAEHNLPVTAGAVRQWFRRDEAWTGRYEQAKKALAQALAEEAIRVARDSTNQSSAADRLLIDTLRWAASKANPAEYGDRQTVQHEGAQTLKVQVVEDDAPAHQPRESKQVPITTGTVKAVESAVMQTLAAQTVTIPS